MRRLLLLFLISLWPTFSWAYMPLNAPMAFLGEVKKNGVGQTATLTLLDGHYFVLKQTFFAGAKQFTRCMTGNWRQKEGGAVLELKNAHGLALAINVGIDNLYGIFPSMAADQAPLLVMTKTSYAHPTFTLMGKLVRKGKVASLEDSATGRTFTVVGEDIRRLPDGEDFFVDAEMAFDNPVSKLLRLRSRSRHFPSRVAERKEVPFADFVRDTTFWVTFPSGLTVSCVFTEKQEGQGTFDVSGKGLWLSIPYQQRDNSLSFTLKPADLRMLTICEATELTTLLQSTRFWEQDGSSLLFCDANGELALLENARFRHTNAPIGVRRR